MAHLCFARALCGVTRSASIQPVLFRNVQRCMSSGCPGYPWLKHGILCERNSMKIYVTSIEATYTKRSTFRMCTSSRLLSYQSSPDKKDDEIFKHGTWMGSRYVRPAGKLLKWIASKLMIVVDGYESFLEKKFPKAFKVYRTFAWGKSSYQHVLLFLTIKFYICRYARFRKGSCRVYCHLCRLGYGKTCERTILQTTRTLFYIS